MAAFNNPGDRRLGILEQLIGLDGGASITDETLNTLTEAVVVMTTTAMPSSLRRAMLDLLLRTKNRRRTGVGIAEELYKAAAENLHGQVGSSMLRGLLGSSPRDWQPTYTLLEAAARNSFDTFQLLQEHKRTRIL
jgi:hypothetical protein